MNAGLYPGMPDPDYRAINAVAHSDLVAFADGRKPEDRRHFIVGRALHAVMADAKAAGEAFTTSKVELDLRTKYGRDELERTERETGKTVLRPSERESVSKMVRALRSHTLIRRFINCPGDHEIAAVAELVPCVLSKGLLDKRCNGKKLFIVDWKTTHHADEKAFLDAIWDYRYASQGAYYCDLLHKLGGEFPRFFFACVSKQTHQAWVTELTPEWYRAGRRWYMDMLSVYGRFGDHAPAGLEESANAAQRATG